MIKTDTWIYGPGARASTSPLWLGGVLFPRGNVGAVDSKENSHECHEKVSILKGGVLAPKESISGSSHVAQLRDEDK